MQKGKSYLIAIAFLLLHKITLTAVHVQGSHITWFQWLFWGCEMKISEGTADAAVSYTYLRLRHRRLASLKIDEPVNYKTTETATNTTLVALTSRNVRRAADLL